MASGANMLVRKSMFQALGGFDERLPFGYEDVELCWRAWVHGWKTLFVPRAVCWHRVGASSGSAEGSRLGFRGVLGGRLLSATKLLPLSYTIRTLFATLAGLAPDIARLRWQRARDRLRILSDYARFLPPLLRERRELYRSGHTSPRQQLERLLRLGVA
jgi:GT2 family glycosyltransferase